MNKAFTKETDSDDDEELPVSPLPVSGKNYITPQGYERLRCELLQLIDIERPKVVDIVHWAASNGDRSENGDYLYGKKRLREIDRRIRFLTQRLEIAALSDPSIHYGNDQVFFGATVSYRDGEGLERIVTILGIDEAVSSLGAESRLSCRRWRDRLTRNFSFDTLALQEKFQGLACALDDLAKSHT